MLTRSLWIIFVVWAGNALAGQDEILTAQGIGYALAVVNKCTGIDPPSNYLPRLRAGLANNGINDDDFQKGFISGTTQAFMRFSSKPPRSECKEAKAMMAQLDKSLGL